MITNVIILFDWFQLNSNACSLKAATCKSSGAIQKVADGECPKKSTPEGSSSLPSNHDGQEDDEEGHNNGNDSNNESSPTKPCRMNNLPTDDEPAGPETGEQPPTLCVKPCTKILKPVCGDDGNTYNNICLLENASCNSFKPVYKVKDGPCTSNTNKPAFDARCRLICQRNQAPRCSNSQLQQGETDFCLTPQFVRMIKKCQCNISPTKPTPNRNCPSICPLNYKPICGSDGRDYG